MNLQNWEIEHSLTLISIFIMVIGGIFALFQWNSARKLKNAEFIDKIINQIRFNSDMAKTMYKIDYGPDWYTEDFHNNKSDIEYQIDKLLSYIDYICYLYYMKNISNNEFNIFKYEINRICISSSVQAYLWNLYHFSKRNKTYCSFTYLISYGIKSKIFEKDFKENNNDLYVKRLNF
jgi:hypothetical protein